MNEGAAYLIVGFVLCAYDKYLYGILLMFASILYNLVGPTGVLR